MSNLALAMQLICCGGAVIGAARLAVDCMRDLIAEMRGKR